MATPAGYLRSFSLNRFGGRGRGRGALRVFVDRVVSSLGAASGDAAGFARGIAVGNAFREQVADEEFAAGVASGLARGIMLGATRAEHEIEEAREDGAADAFPGAFLSGSLAPSAAETDPPELGTVSPVADTVPGEAGAFPADYATAKDTPIAIPVVDAESAIAFVVLSALYVDRTGWETVYAGRPAIDGVGGYLTGYQAHSSVSGTGEPGVGFTFSVRNDTGWPGQLGVSSQVKIDTKAVDAKGNVLA